MSLTQNDKNDIREIAELEVRKYFDYFLREVYPKITASQIKGCPHGKRVSKFKWIAVGFIAALAIVIPTFGKTLLAVVMKL